MADIFFFTDTDLLSVQSVDEKFGPVNGFETSKYRLSSLHKSSSASNVYAICSGTIFVQQNESSIDLVNLVLKPTVQPNTSMPHIAYFIYKGIKKNSIIATGGTEIVASGASDLATSIWDSQDNRNASLDKAQGNPPGTTTDNPPVELLGINYTEVAAVPYKLMDNEHIDRIFFSTDLDYQLPTVQGGWSIGKFDPSGFSLEIVFESINSRTKAEEVRTDSLLEVPELSGGETHAQIFTHWNQKERILSYCDPAAFFGGFYADRLFAKKSTDPGFSDFSGDDIYSEILAKFENKNRVYIDIRNELNYSFNYYDNYGNELEMAFDDTSPLATINYRRGNWPILIVDTDFPSGNTTESNLFRIVFPKGDNDFPRLFINKGANEYSFPKNVSFDEQFLNLIHSDVSTYNLNELEFYTPNFVDSDTTPVANYLRLSYLKSLPAYGYRESYGTVPQAKIGMDNLFQPIHMVIDWKMDISTTQVQVFNDIYYVDMRVFNKHSYWAKQGISRDSNGDVVYFAFAFQSLESGRASTPDAVIESRGNLDGSIFSFIGKNMGALFSNVSIELDGSTVNLERVSHLFSGADDETLILSPHEFVHVRLTAADIVTINDIIGDPVHAFLTDFPIMLGVNLAASGMDDNYRVSYNRFNYSINGYYLNTGTNEIELKSVDTGIYSYRLQKSLK